MNKELTKIINIINDMNISKYNRYELQGIYYCENRYKAHYHNFIVEGVSVYVDRYINNNSVCYNLLNQLKSRLKRYKNIAVVCECNAITIYDNGDYIAYNTACKESQNRIDNYNNWRHYLIEKYGLENVK